MWADRQDRVGVKALGSKHGSVSGAAAALGGLHFKGCPLQRRTALWVGKCFAIDWLFPSIAVKRWGSCRYGR